LPFLGKALERMPSATPSAATPLQVSGHGGRRRLHWFSLCRRWSSWSPRVDRPKTGANGFEGGSGAGGDKASVIGAASWRHHRQGDQRQQQRGRHDHKALLEKL
jgi:hypothetical protein